MKKLKYILTIAVLLIGGSTALAQQRITGHVYDDVEPVMMANVVERDANNRIVEAAVTDMNGNFSMVVKNPKDYLVVSYVGYKTYRVQIGNQTKFNIHLQDANMIEEVVIKAKPKTQSDDSCEGGVSGNSDHEHGRRGRLELRLCRRSLAG